MNNYKKYFEHDEELLNKLEQLHAKKIRLRELLKNKDDKFVFELAGLPRTGKSVSTQKIFQFFKNGEIDIIRAEEPAFMIKNNLSFNDIRNMSSLEFNDKTLEVSKESLKQAKNSKANIILMDRGVIDNYFWYKKMLDENEIDLSLYSNRINNLESDLKEIDKLFILFANPEIVIYRDYINQIYLEDRNKTTIEKVTQLKKGYEDLIPIIRGYDQNKIDIFDTSNNTAVDTSIHITNEIMDTIEKKLTLNK